MVRAYYRAGYSGIIITDHFFNGNSCIPDHLPWEERVELFCRGYENALREASKLDFRVFFGWEYADDGAEFLTYGLGKDFLLKYPDMLSWPIEKYLRVVREHGGFVSQAHPYREAWYIKQIRVFPEHVDAIEVRQTQAIWIPNLMSGHWNWPTNTIFIIPAAPILISLTFCPVEAWNSTVSCLPSRISSVL